MADPRLQHMFNRPQSTASHEVFDAENWLNDHQNVISSADVMLTASRGGGQIMTDTRLAIGHAKNCNSDMVFFEVALKNIQSAMAKWEQAWIDVESTCNQIRTNFWSKAGSCPHS